MAFSPQITEKQPKRNRRIRVTICLPPSVVERIDKEAYLSDLFRSRFAERLIVSGMASTNGTKREMYEDEKDAA